MASDGDVTSPMFPMRDLPRYEELRARAARYPDIDPSAVEATLTLMRVSADALMAFDAYAVRAHKISLGRLTVLTILNRDPSAPLSPSVLADRAGVTRATMTGLLDRLERDRLVRRTLDRSDRRKMTIALTPKGTAFLDAVLPAYYQRAARLMRDLTEPQRRALTDMLLRVRERIDDVRSTAAATASATDGDGNGDGRALDA